MIIQILIFIYPNTIFYRGIPEKDKIIEIIQKDKPIYLGSEDIAKLYGKVYKIEVIESYRLLDIRKIISILQIILDSIKIKNLSADENNDFHINIMRLMIAFGLTIYPHQITLLKEYYEIMNINTKQKNIRRKNKLYETI